MRGIGKRSLTIELLVALLIALGLGLSVGMSKGDEGMPWVTAAIRFNPEISASCLEKGMLNPVLSGAGDPSAMSNGEIAISDPDGIVQIQLDTRSLSTCWTGVVTFEGKVDSNDLEKHLSATLSFEPKIRESCLGVGMLIPRIESGDPSATTDRIIMRDGADGAAQFKLDIQALSTCWVGVVTFKAEDPDNLSEVEPLVPDYIIVKGRAATIFTAAL